jgi:hypothetical protein
MKVITLITTVTVSLRWYHPDQVPRVFSQSRFVADAAPRGAGHPYGLLEYKSNAVKSQ